MFEAAVKKDRKHANATMDSVCLPLGQERSRGILVQLKERREQIRGLSFGSGHTHYHFGFPAKLGALAYTQENQDQISSGHEYQTDEAKAGKMIAPEKGISHHVVQRCLIPAAPEDDSSAEIDYDKEDEYVIRGGTCLPEQFLKGSKEYKDLVNSGADLKQAQEKLPLTGISVNYNGRCSVRELSKTIPHNKLGVATKNNIPEAEERLKKTDADDNPYHHELSGLTASRLGEIFIKVVNNPTNKKNRPKKKTLEKKKE